LIGYKISGDDNNNENNYTAGSNNNDNPISLAEIKHSKYNFIIKIKTF